MASVRDKVGVVLQVCLTAVGVHMALAVGFCLRWGDHALVCLRHPLYGILLIWLGWWVRWLVSNTYRRQCERGTGVARSQIQSYSAGSRSVPWRASFCWVFFPALLIYQSNDRTITSGDTVPMVQTALSLVNNRDLALDQFVNATAPPYYVCRIDGHFYSRYSLGPAIVALPFVQLAEWLGADLHDKHMRLRLEKLIASIVAAASVPFVFFVLLRLARPGVATLLTAYFALGSQNWMVSSQALWQHGPVCLSAAIVLFIEYHYQGRVPWRLTTVEGAILGFSLACRPTAVILVVVLGLLALRRRLRQFGLLVLAAALAYLPFLLIHLGVYHSLLGPYAHGVGRGAWAADYGVSIPGNLISPARGLLVYQPLMGLAVLAVLPRVADRIGRAMAWALGLWFVVHLLVVSRWTLWWGGHCWGPRFLTELMPALLVLSTPAVAWLWRYRPGKALVLVLIGWSILLQGTGAYTRAAHRWMSDPVDIDQAPGRLWDWRDPPFLYPWRGLLVSHAPPPDNEPIHRGRSSTGA